MQSSTGQYSTQAGDPAHPVQHSVITASSFGFFFRGVFRPWDRGSCLSSSGTIPTAGVDMGGDYNPALGNWHLAFGRKQHVPRRPNANCQMPNALLSAPHHTPQPPTLV